MRLGDTPAVPAFPLSLFPLAQLRIRALLEQADEATLAGQSAWADRLVATAREEAHALRATIGGLGHG